MKPRCATDPRGRRGRPRGRGAAASDAAASGLQPGDRILAINGRPLRDAIDFQFYGADDELQLTVERAGGDDRAHPAPAPGRPRRAAGPTPTAGHRDLRQRLRVLLHPPEPQRAAQEPLRQGRRLPPLLPARQLHYAQRSGRGGAATYRRTAPVAALRLRARHRSRATPPPAGPAAPLRRDPATPGAAGRGRDPDARPDRPLPGAQRRRPPGVARCAICAAPPARGHGRHRARRAHPAPRASARAAAADVRRGARPARHGRRLAGELPGPAGSRFVFLADEIYLLADRPLPEARRLRRLPDRRGRCGAGAPLRGRPQPRGPRPAPRRRRRAATRRQRRALRSAAGPTGSSRWRPPASPSAWLPCPTTSSAGPSAWPGC